MKPKFKVKYPLSLLIITMATTAPSITIASDDDAILLPAFEVSTTMDRGYLSTNTSSGTSLNISLRDVPQSISIINQEFIEDQHATNLNEALSYEAGVFTQEFTISGGANALTGGTFLPSDRSPSAVASAGQRGTNSISIRGFAVPNQQRLGFRVGNIFVGRSGSIVLGGSTDTANISRMEVVRGPASLLYGLNVLSGVVNIIPREPTDVFRGDVSISAGSWDYFRSTLNLSGPLVKDRVNYRVATSYQENGSWISVREDKRRTYTGQLAIRPFANNRMSVLLEASRAESIERGIGFATFTSDTGGNSQLFQNRWGEQVRFGYDFTMEDAQLFNLQEQDRHAEYLRVNDEFGFPTFGDDYRISGPDTFSEDKENTLLALMRLQPLENLSMEFGGYYSEITREERLINGGVFTNQEGGVSILSNADPMNPGIRRLAADRILRRGNMVETLSVNPYLRNPEVGLIQRDDFSSIVSDESFFERGDIAVGFGPGENFRIANLMAITHPDADLQAIRDQFGIRHSLDVQEMRIENPERYQEFVDAINAGIQSGRVPSGAFALQDARKYARYYWWERDQGAESMQLRARLNYAFEGSMFGDRLHARHVLSGGATYMRDKVSLVSGGPTVANTYTNPLGSGNNRFGLEGALLSEDPYIFRNSVFDTSMIRYNGEAMAIPGNISTARLEGIEAGAGTSIVRSGWIDSEVTYESIFGIYQGYFFNDRLTIVAGIRNDRYDVTERERLRVVVDNDFFFAQPDSRGYYDAMRANGVAVTGGGNGYMLTDRFAGYGTEPYVWDPSLPDNLNERIQNDLLALQANQPGGTVEPLFSSPPSFTTGTFGFTYRLRDEISLQGVYSEGVFPNTGQRDGNFQPIEAEQTRSYELGFKFDLLDGKISGRISGYRIERKNAVFNWLFAPNPASWLGGDNFSRGGNREGTSFDPQVAQFLPTIYPDSNAARTRAVGLTQAPRAIYFRRALEDFASTDGPWASVVTDDQRQMIQAALAQADAAGREAPAFNHEVYNLLGNSGELGLGSTGPATVSTFRNNQGLPNRPTLPNVEFMVVRINGENGVLSNPNNMEVDGVEVGNVIKHALDLAINDRNADNYPFLWSTEGGNESQNINNASLNTGTNITYAEEVTGIDGQLFYLPTANYQMIFSFSYQDRRVVGNGLNLVSTMDRETGAQLGTPYDQWVWILGKENFADPSDPTTFDGTGVVGSDLSGVPALNLSFWNKYTFTEGPLSGLEIGGGINYQGSAVTSPAIGGRDFSLNRFSTPKSAAQYRIDLSLNYNFQLFDLDWRLGLKVNNLLDRQEWVREAVYYDEVTERNVYRRHRAYNAPRNFRVSLTTSF